MNPKVSVIVPIYNVEKYLRKCLQSLKEQTYENLEILMVNDGTPDNSEAICREFAELDHRFVLLNKKNGGLSSARNLGLDHATGEYVSFVDSDDWVQENFISSLMDCAKTGAEVVISKYILDDRNLGKNYVPFRDCTVNRVFEGEEKKRQIVYNHIGANCPDGRYLIPYAIMPVWKNLYSRSFIEENNLRFVSEREVYAEDYLFNLQAYILAKKVYVTDAAEYVHLIVKGSLSQGYRKNLFQMGMRRMELEQEILLKYYTEAEARLARHKLPDILSHSAMHSCRTDHKTAMDHIHTIIHHPFSEGVFRDGYKPKAARNRPIYFLLRHKQQVLCVLLVKLMLWGEGFYRFAKRFSQ